MSLIWKGHWCRWDGFGKQSNCVWNQAERIQQQLHHQPWHWCAKKPRYTWSWGLKSRPGWEDRAHRNCYWQGFSPIVQHCPSYHQCRGKSSAVCYKLLVLLMLPLLVRMITVFFWCNPGCQWQCTRIWSLLLHFLSPRRSKRSVFTPRSMFKCSLLWSWSLIVFFLPIRCKSWIGLCQGYGPNGRLQPHFIQH